MNADPGAPAAARFKRPESVLVVVYTATGRVLLLKRADHPNFWQSITGSLEWGDATPHATALRELREETGIVTQSLRDWRLIQRYEIFPEYRHRYEPHVTHNTEHAFSLALPDVCPVAINPLEHSAYEWVSFPEAIARATSWTNRDMLLLLSKELAAAS